MLPIVESLYRPLLYINMASFNAVLRGKDIPYVFNSMMFQMFGEVGGSGCTLGLVIYILVFSQRHDNRLIANISLFPSLANINETVIFGMPIVLNHSIYSCTTCLSYSGLFPYFNRILSTCDHGSTLGYATYFNGLLSYWRKYLWGNITSHMYMYLSTCVCAIYLYI